MGAPTSTTRSGRTGSSICRGEHGGEPAAIAAIIERYRPLAVLMNEFYWRLFHEARTTPFPAEEVQRLVALTLAGR